MKKIIILLFIISLTAGTLFSQSVTIKLIETSDLHGQIFPHDFINNKPADNSMAQIYSYIKEERAKKDQFVILLDDGDLLQGQPIVYYYNFEKPDTTHIVSSVMNFMNYDAATIGNHDIETGHRVYDKFKNEFNFPWLAANVVDKKTGQPYFEPYTIIERGGVKVAVLGLITPHIPHWLPEKIWEGMQFEDMVESAQKWVGIIKKNEDPDLMVGLFHSGVDYTYGNVTADTYKNENASQLVAERVEGFDIIFVGHDHQGWNEIVPNNFNDVVLVLGTKGYASTIAEVKADFAFNEELNDWETTLYGNIIETKDYVPDKTFLKEFDYAYKNTINYVNKPIGELTRSIFAGESIFGDAAFSDVIHTIQLDLTGADISFTAPLSLYTRLNEGTIYVRDMFDLYKYENLLYTIELTGIEVKDYLEYTYSLWFNRMKDKDDHLLNFEKDDSGNIKYSERSSAPMLKARYYNFDSAEGIEYSVDVSKPAGERITIKNFNDGRKFDFDKVYKIAVNSYRGNGGGGHLVKGAGIPHEKLAQRIINSTEKDLRYYLIQWIREHKNIDIKCNYNWNVVPDNWYRNGVKRDSKLLFGESIIR